MDTRWTLSWADVSKPGRVSEAYYEELAANNALLALQKKSGVYNIRLVAETSEITAEVNTVSDEALAEARDTYRRKEELVGRFYAARDRTGEANPFGLVSFSTIDSVAGKVSMTLECYEALVYKAFPEDSQASVAYTARKVSTFPLFNRGDWVHLTQDYEGHPKGQPGTVTAYHRVDDAYRVLLSDNCNHLIPASILEIDPGPKEEMGG
jgi:hypothetical protein